MHNASVHSESAACPTGNSRRVTGFCQKLSPGALADLSATGVLQSLQAGEILFSEKQQTHGVFLLREGQARLSMSSRDGRRLSLRITRAGDVLGLAPTLSGHPSETTAETLTAAKIVHVPAAEFRSFLARHPEVSRLVIEEISLQYATTCEQLRTVGLSSSAPEKLARLLLDLSESGQTVEDESRFRFMLTHEQVGEFIGASRETVTRTLGAFKTRRLVALNGCMLTIPSRSALQTYACS